MTTQRIWRIVGRDHDGEVFISEEIHVDQARGQGVLEGMKQTGAFDELWLEQGLVTWPEEQR